MANHVNSEADVWFLDPPYESNLGEKALLLMAQSPYVTKDALVVLETSSQAEPPRVAGFDIEENRRYGTTRLVFYRRLSSDPIIDDGSSEQDEEPLSEND